MLLSPLCISCWTRPAHMSYCHRCDRSFSSFQALEQHVENSSSHFVCNECRIDLASDDELHEHCRQLHWYCSTCKEVFESAEDLRVHRRSPDHHSKCLSCPVASCKKQFASVSAIMQHLERGDCRPASGARPSAAVSEARARARRETHHAQRPPLALDLPHLDDRSEPLAGMRNQESD